jgi:hypothetical protein
MCGENNWDVLIYTDEENIEATMPYYSPDKGVIAMPAFTQTLGIWFNPAFEDKKYSKNLLRKQLICKYFIEKLPPHQYFLQNFHYSFTDWLPFYWMGYQQTTRYSYILPDISNLDELKRNLGRSIRESIRKAVSVCHLEVKRNIPADWFMNLNAQTYKRQGKKAYRPEMLKKLIDTALSRKQGDIWGALDENGRLHAAVFIVWQDSCAYAIGSAADVELRHSGGQVYTMWTAICDVSEITSAFDFEGSMIQGVEHSFREFGGRQIPYFTISKGKFSLSKKLVIKMKQQLLKKF